MKPRVPAVHPRAAVCFLSLAVAGCDFDGDRQADIAYPRVVELKNASPERIDLTALSSTPDAGATFFLEGEPLPPAPRGAGASAWTPTRTSAPAASSWTAPAAALPAGN